MRFLDIPFLYYVIAAGIGIGLYIWKRNWWLGVLFAYCVLIYSIAVLNRAAGGSLRYELRLFWSWREWERQSQQILLNIMVFVPIGILAARLWKWKGLLFATGFSILIEISQLITHRGLFEFDDIVHNSLGAAVGVCIYMLIDCLKLRNRSSKDGFSE